MATNISQFLPRKLMIGMHDAVVDGEVVQDIPSRMVFVTQESDLARFTDIEPVGTIAAQYGFSNMWQLSSDGTWVSIGTAAEEET